MNGRELPILNFTSFRKYPAKQAQQSFADDAQVCHGCLSGVCCLTEDPIGLTSFDILRLASFFDMSPAQFMFKFTQDSFAGEDSDERRRSWNDDPKSSIVTWLRRRDNFPTSPCIFLKYIREPDGTPHRICSIHDGRPLSCREFYFQHCKTRGTGELAALLAEGFEKVRDGEITEQMIDAELKRLGQLDFKTAALAQSMEYHFWVEMKRVLNMEQANIEGANSYNMADYQDPMDEKLNRVLSSKFLRFEEKYGLRPRDEQLMPYTSGLNFAGSSEYERIMTVLRSEPTSGLFRLGDYPHWIGVRTMVPGVRPAEVFRTIPKAEVKQFLAGIPPVRLFPAHDLPEVRSITLPYVYAAILAGYNHLLRFASHIVALAPILEFEPPGTIEANLLSMLAGFHNSLNTYVARNPYFEPVKQHMTAAAIELLEERLAETTSTDEIFDLLRTLCTLQPLVPTLPTKLRARVKALGREVDARLRKDELELYVRTDNPIAARMAAGRRLGDRGAWSAWDAWREQVLDMRYAAIAGFDGVDLSAFYSEAVRVLETIPLRKSYTTHLCDIVKSLAHSMSSFNRIAFRAMPYKDAANRLAVYAIRLLDWMQSVDDNNDWEAIAELSSAVHKGFGLGYNHDRSFGLVVYRLLKSQLPDGSWATNPTPADKPDTQAEYLHRMYRTTWTCLDCLRPIRNDLLNAGNASLGLA
jgi:Fe-S-cluster containining protein